MYSIGGWCDMQTVAVWGFLAFSLQSYQYMKPWDEQTDRQDTVHFADT